MQLSTSHFIPMKLSSRSRSSTGSWDSNSSSGSFTEDPGQVPSWGSRSKEIVESGWRSPHGLTWGFYYDKKIEGKRMDEIFWQDGVNQSSRLEAEQPDLLDRLIKEDQEEEIVKFMAMSQYRRVSLQQLPSLENLLKLLEIQQMSPNPPEGRPITGGQVTPSPSTTYLDMMSMQQAQVTHVFPNMFPPINYKVPPPHHPPAVPASFHLPPSTQHYQVRAPFQTPSSPSPSPTRPTPGSAV